MRGVRAFMGWTHILDLEYSPTSRTDISHVEQEVVDRPASHNSSVDLSLPAPSFQKDLDEKWSLRMARLEALITMGHKSSPHQPAFSPVKVPFKFHISHLRGQYLKPLLCSLQLFPQAGPASSPYGAQALPVSTVTRSSPLDSLYPDNDPEPVFQQPGPVPSAQSSTGRYKFCELCFFCRSLCFCPNCDKCPQCCSCPTSRRAPSALLANLGPPRSKFKGGVYPKRGVYPPIQTQTPSSEAPPDNQWLCQSQQKPFSKGGSSKPSGQKGSRDGKGSSISSLFQQVVHSFQTQPKMATSLGSQCSKQIFERKNIQNGNPRDNLGFLATRGMGDVTGFQRRLFPHSSSCQVPEISQVPLPKSVLSVPGPSLWPLHSSNVVHWRGQRGEVNGSIPGYKDPPVPRRLVDSSPYQRILPPGHSIPPHPLPGVGLDSEPTKVRTGTQTDFQVRGLQVRSFSRPGLTNSKPLGVDSPKVGIHPIQAKLPSQEIYVPDRPAYSNGKTGSHGQTPHKTHPVAPKTTLESSRIPGKGDSCPKITSTTPSMVDQGDKCLDRTALTSFESCRSNLYRRLKRRLGCSLRRLHSKRRLVSSRKSYSHKLPGTKSGFTSLEKIPALSTRKSSSSCHRQHHSCGVHQQGRRYEVRLTLCPSLATPVLVQSETGSSKGQAHPWSSECDCRQTISSRPSHSDRMVTSPGVLRPPGSDLAPSPSGHVCNKVQLQTSPVCVSSTRHVSWENLDMYVFPPVSLLGKVVSKLLDHLYKRVILIAPGLPNMPWFWDLVELSSQIPLCLPSHPDLVTQPFNKAHHRNLTNLTLHAWLLEPRLSRSKGSLAQWHHELRLLKEVQPEQSMRQSGPFLSDGVNQVRWTSGLHLSNR